MKSLILITLLLPAFCFGQDSIVVKVPVGQATGMTTANLDTNNVLGFTNKVKGLINWVNITGKPATYNPATHSHPISEVTGLQSAIDLKLTDPTRPPTTSYRLMIGNNTQNGYVVRMVNGQDIANGNVTITATDVNLGSVNNTPDASKPVSALQQAALDLKANLSLVNNVTNESKATMLASPPITGNPSIGGKISAYNGITLVSNGIPTIVAEVNATAQTANIGTTALYTTPAAGMYRVNIYITVTTVATTSSTMPNTSIVYTDGNSGTNGHSTTTTATSTGNSVTSTFAQVSHVMYVKSGTNINYATGSYASSGATAMQYALRIRLEAL